MQSSNPVFQRSGGFNGRASKTSPTSGMHYPAYGTETQQPPTYVDRGRMTIDSVVQKTGMTLGLVVLVAAVTWVMTPDITGLAGDGGAGRLMMLSVVGGVVGFGLAMLLSFKKQISPPLVLAYAVAEGVFIGAVSKFFESMYPGVVMGAVVGTFAAVGGTLAAYKFFDIQVGTKFRKWVTAAMFGFVAVTMLDFVLSFFHAQIGFNGLGGLGLVMSVVGLCLGVLMLILDFDYVERGVAAGLPEVESWRAAFGLTVTIVWIYIEILRILSILRN
jgi:uncharacterized YccA/Bax inhibitor family protein